MQDPEVVIEPLIGREVPFFESEMPFADARRGVPLRLEQFSQGQARRRDSSLGVGTMYPDLAAGSSRIASREQSCPRGTTNRSGGIVVGEPDTFARERVDSRRLDFGRPIATEVVVPLIIDEDEDDIGASRFSSSVSAIAA